MTRDEFDAAWDQFFGALRRARGQATSEMEREGISLAQFQLLYAYADRDSGESLPVGVLAETAGLAQPTATRMLDSLEREGVIERGRSTEDRRSVVVTLTAKGRKLLKRKRELVQAKRAALYESLPPADRERAAELLRRLADLIEEPK